MSRPNKSSALIIGRDGAKQASGSEAQPHSGKRSRATVARAADLTPIGPTMSITVDHKLRAEAPASDFLATHRLCRGNRIATFEVNAGAERATVSPLHFCDGRKFGRPCDGSVRSNEEEILFPRQRTVSVWLLAACGRFHHVVAHQPENLVDLDARGRDALGDRYCEG